MRRFLSLCLLALCALWVHIAAGQGSIASPAPTQSPANVSTAPAQTVWVNTHSKVYHYAGSRWFGRTERGKYVGETEALAEGDRAAKNEYHPPALPMPPAGPTPSPAPDPPTPQMVTLPQADLLAVCVEAIAAQSDPAKLATLGERGANPRHKRIMYYLAQARAGGADPGEVIDRAQRQNNSFGTPRAPLVKANLLRNLKICDGLGLLTPQNLAGLRRGNAPTVTRGPYAGQKAEVDHIVPLARARGIGNELANLEMLPASLNRVKSDKVGERQLALANKFHDAGLLSDAELVQVRARFRPAGTERYELAEP